MLSSIPLSMLRRTVPRYVSTLQLPRQVDVVWPSAYAKFASAKCRLMDGKRIANGILNALAYDVKRITDTRGKPPMLMAILVGGNRSLAAHSQNVQRAAIMCGVQCQIVALPDDTPQETIVEIIREANANPMVDGIQLGTPLPPHIEFKEVSEVINPEKDIEGLHPKSVGRLFSWRQCVHYPCTPRGVMVLLKECEVPLDGKVVVVIGESNVVGMPLAPMLVAAGATPVLCHKRTPDFSKFTRLADVVVVSAGSPNLLRKNHVQDGVVVVDVGFNVDAHGQVNGDVHPEVSGVASAMTPVPGGVGPMTCAMLMRNIVRTVMVSCTIWVDVVTGLAAVLAMRPASTWRNGINWQEVNLRKWSEGIPWSPEDTNMLDAIVNLVDEGDVITLNKFRKTLAALGFAFSNSESVTIFENAGSGQSLYLTRGQMISAMKNALTNPFEPSESPDDMADGDLATLMRGQGSTLYEYIGSEEQ